MADGARTVEVSRRIEVPAARIFAILSTPQRHSEFDGSGMVRGAVTDGPISRVGETFTVRMHRLGRDYSMINHVVEFEPHRVITWEPAPGDIDTAGGDASRIGVPSGYRWGYRLDPDGDSATLVTEVFDCGSDDNRWILEQEGGGWINGHNPVLESMTATLARLEEVITE
jgi:hypothetical protein